MSEFCERVLFSIFGPPHGGALCWAARIVSLAWALFLMSLLVLGLANGGTLNPFLVLPLIGLATALAGLRWHLVPAICLTTMGVLGLGALLVDSLFWGSHPGAGPLYAMALLAGGIVNIMALVEERQT